MYKTDKKIKILKKFINLLSFNIKTKNSKIPSIYQIISKDKKVCKKNSCNLPVKIKPVALTVTHAAPNPVLFYEAISNFLVLRVRAE